MWRIRNVIQIFITFFLWSTVFTDPGRQLFGYDKTKILTYVFGITIVKAFVLSSRAVDVAGDIARGDLSNYLIKPISYFKYWFTRDFSSKVLNLVFAIGEFIILFIILKPALLFQTDPVLLITFFLSISFAVFMFFCLLFMISSVPFWAPELGWGSQFLVIVILLEFLSGSLFPLDILPIVLQRIIMVTPFPYLLFFPVQVYLGKIEGYFLLSGMLISLSWSVLLYFAMKFIWNKGLKSYQAFGR